MAEQPEEEVQEESVFSLRKAIPYLLRDIARERKTGRPKEGSSFEIAIYGRAEREKGGNIEFNNVDTENLSGSQLLKLAQTSGGTIKIPRKGGKTSNTEDILFFGLTKLNVIGEGTTNLTLNISFDAARIFPKIENVMKKEDEDLGMDEYAASLSDADNNNNEQKVNPLYEAKVKEEPMDDEEGEDIKVLHQDEPVVEKKEKSEYVNVKRTCLEQVTEALQAVKKCLIEDDELMAALASGDDDTTDEEAC